MTHVDKHDWPKIIKEIEASGITLYKLASMLGKQLVQVQRWRDGSEPRHHEGEMLLRVLADARSTGNITTVTVPNTQTTKARALFARMRERTQLDR